MLEWRRDWEVKVLNNRHPVVLVRVVEEAEGLPEAVVATTAPVGTTQTQALKPMHQQHLGVRVPAGVEVVDSEVVVVAEMGVDVVADGSTSDMTPAAEGKNLQWCRSDVMLQSHNGFWIQLTLAII